LQTVWKAADLIIPVNRFLLMNLFFIIKLSPKYFPKQSQSAQKKSAMHIIEYIPVQISAIKKPQKTYRYFIESCHNRIGPKPVNIGTILLIIPSKERLQSQTG
jgi:hypothetical protein